MRFGTHGFFLGAAALALLSAGPATAAPQSVAEIANYQGADRQAVLEAGAKKEGSVLVYTTGAQTDPILDAYSKKYPFVRLEAFRDTGSTGITRRVLEEVKANRHTVDAILLNTGGLQVLRDAGVLQPFWSPEMAKYKPQAVESNKLWVVDKESYLSLGFNTKVYSEDAVPKTYDDLLDPKWKGKLAVQKQGVTLPNWVGAIVVSKGEEFLRKLGKQDIAVYQIGGRGLSNLVVSGEVPISPTIYSGHMATSKDQGASVGWRALGAVYANLGGDAIAKSAPHPHAAMLLIDFMLGRQGQAMYQKFGYATARTDMENRERADEAIYLTERPNYIQEFEKWTALTDQVFGAGKKPPAKKK